MNSFQCPLFQIHRYTFTKCIFSIQGVLKNGKGNGFANPPDNFSPEIKVEKERKSAFVKSCMIEIEDHEMYHKWKNDLFSKQRSCGPNIFDTEKVVVLEKTDGTVKKTVTRLITRRSQPNLFEVALFCGCCFCCSCCH